MALPSPASAASPAGDPASDRPVNVLLFAVAGAVAVANIYFPQPLLAAVAQSLDVSERTAGLIASAAQLGYALGILTLVPLADTARLRRLTSVLLVLTCAALLVGAAAPGVVTLTLATLALSTTTVLPQILTPVAAVLAGPGRRGRTVGLVGLGLTLGSTLSRTVSGAVADAMMALYFAIALGGWLLVDGAASFRPFYVAHVICSGAYFTAAAAMPLALFPREEFVRYNASKDILVAFANILVASCIGPLLDHSGHDYRLTLGSAVLFSLLALACLGRLLAAHTVPSRAPLPEPTSAG